MSEAAGLLNAIAQALSALSLYPEGHSTRERALDSVYERLGLLLSTNPRPRFSFLGEEVVYGDVPFKEMRGWDWSTRLSDLGIQRLQFDSTVTREELEGFLDELLARLTLSAIDTSEARQMRPSGIQWGAIGIRGEERVGGGDIQTATIAFTLHDEAETVRWLHDEISTGHDLPLTEAEAVIRALSVAMHGDQRPDPAASQATQLRRVHDDPLAQRRGLDHGTGRMARPRCPGCAHVWHRGLVARPGEGQDTKGHLEQGWQARAQ